MAQMKMADIQREVKASAFEEITSHFGDRAVQYDDYQIAVPYTVDGEERWAKISVVCGQLKDTKTSPAFDPFEVAEDWKIDKEYKAKEKASKEKAKADKIARSKAKTKSKTIAEG